MGKYRKVNMRIAKRSLKLRLGNQCVFCGCKNPLVFIIDHKVPLSRGGLDDNSNKQILCKVCDNLKADMTNSEFRKYYNTLISLYKLGKVRLDYAGPLNVIFNPTDIANGTQQKLK